MAHKATFKLVKRCKSVDKYDEIDEVTEEVIKGTAKTPLLGTVYVNKDVAQGRDRITITVE